MELEVLEVRKESDKIQDLPARAPGLFEGKESQRWQKVPEVPLNVWHKARYFKIVNSKLLEVRECGKVRQGTPAELFGGEHVIIAIPRTDPEPFDERKQTELV